MKAYVLGCLAMSVLWPGSASADKRPLIDHTDPVKVTEEIFRAARDRDATGLPGLCDPKGENDGDTKRVCGARPGAKKWDEFVKWFSTGKVKGPAETKGDRARVAFSFGPDGKRTEEMILILRDGKWYLFSF